MEAEGLAEVRTSAANRQSANCTSKDTSRRLIDVRLDVQFQQKGGEHHLTDEYKSEYDKRNNAAIRPTPPKIALGRLPRH